jgi:CelD/BcsL family acetyltransferase involved in cellulose biosynthesis
MIREVMGWLAREGSGDHLHFEKLSSEGALHRALHQPGATPAGTLSFEKSYAPCPCADLGDGLAGYLSSLPRRTRQDLRNSLSRLQREAPGANVRVVRDLEVKVDDLETAADFHVVHFTKTGRSPLGDPRLVEFFGRVAKDPDVGFQLAFLEHEGGLLAVDFGFVRGLRYYGYLMAYDPANARLAPGKCLLLLRIDRWVKEDGVRILDFLAGDESYKRAYTGGRAYRVWTMRLMPPSLRHRALHLGLRSDRRFREFAKKLLGRNRVASA